MYVLHVSMNVCNCECVWMCCTTLPTTTTTTTHVCTCVCVCCDARTMLRVGLRMPGVRCVACVYVYWSSCDVTASYEWSTLHTYIHTTARSILTRAYMRPTDQVAHTRAHIHVYTYMCSTHKSGRLCTCMRCGCVCICQTHTYTHHHHQHAGPVVALRYYTDMHAALGRPSKMEICT